MDEPEIDLRRIFGTIRRQLRIIVAAVIVAAAVAGIAIFSLTPIYTSSALILIDPSKKNLLDPEAQLIGSSASDSARIDSEVELMRSDNILLDVVRSLDLVKSEEFGPSLGLRAQLMALLRIGNISLPTGEEALNQTLGKVRRAISVQRRALTYLISVEARSESPALAADLANAAASAYIADQVDSKVESVLASQSILNTRIEDARAKLAESEVSFDQFIQQNLDRIAQNSSRSDIRRLQEQFDALRSVRQQSASTAELVSDRLAEGDWQTIVASLQSDALTELEQQREALTDQLTTSDAQSPGSVDLRARLAQIEAEMRSAAEGEISGLRASIQSSEAEEDKLRQELRQIVLQGDLPPEILTQIYEVQQNAQIARDQYQNLLSRSQDLDAQANLQIADGRVVSPALAPSTASFPNNTIILALAIMGGLAVGVALAFLYENFVGGFVSEDQLESVLRVRVAGSVPFAKMPSERDSLADTVLTSPLSAFAESIRRIRASIDQSLRHQDPAMARVIVVSSTAPHEGKSTLALALGRSYAQAGQNTLLIDGDMRKPSIHRHVGADPSFGLLEYLKDPNDGQIEITSIVSRDQSGLSLVLGARRSDVPTDQLIMQPAFRRLIDASRRTFDVVVIDTPPVGPVVDALYVARFADVVLFISKWGATSQSDAKQAVGLLQSSVDDATPTLAVLNGTHASQSNYYRKYGAYYSEA